MLEVAAGVVIEAAKIRAPDTTRDDVVPGGGVEGDEGGTGLGHAGLLPWNLGCQKATAAGGRVQAKWVSRGFVLTEPDRYGDFIAVAVTAVPTAVLAVPITNDDLADGILPKPSWALQALVGTAAGSLSSNP